MNYIKKYISILIILLFCACSTKSSSFYNAKTFNQFTYTGNEFDFDIHSHGYMLIDLSDFNIVYSYNTDSQIFPASLTKVLTLDTVLALEDDLTNTSYVTSSQVDYLIGEDASLAYIQRDYEYTLLDLLYALIIPSGADGALALENYFSEKGIDLVEQMNIQAEKLGLSNSHFVNTTGLHDDDHYTSIDDLFKILMDTLKYQKGREILESLYHRCDDGSLFYSGLALLNTKHVSVLGGKTGYTPEAGQNIMVLYRYRGKSYAIILTNAYGNFAMKEMWHYDDTLNIFEHLYEN